MKTERFCSNCCHYRKLEKLTKTMCLNPQPFTMDIAAKKPDDYCPYHKFKK